jgi:hypothetical protein
VRMTILTGRRIIWDITSNTSLDDNLVRRVTGLTRHKGIRTRQAIIKSTGMDMMRGMGPQEIWLSELGREHLQE